MHRSSFPVQRCDRVPAYRQAGVFRVHVLNKIKRPRRFIPVLEMEGLRGPIRFKIANLRFQIFKSTI
ncbi:MAG: hypothetical protein A2026_16690 [Deltaproteobacteria bacterium RBG_19FT_COMBO_46_12]|nr:MAG: hypothetical protein A2026_16690 [Deltaproteobacteria bacterium RBG_19FT_COMBO_46_12]